MKKSLLTIFALLLLSAGSLFAQQEVFDAKAKFVYNFTKFFEWPASERSGEFVIGIVGSSNMFQATNKFMKGKKVGSQNIVVKKFKGAGDVGKCHLIYVSKFKINDLPNINKTQGKNTLVISESDSGIAKGAVLNFVFTDGRLKYEFSANNATRHGLKFSPKVKDMASKNY